MIAGIAGAQTKIIINSMMMQRVRFMQFHSYFYLPHVCIIIAVLLLLLLLSSTMSINFYLGGISMLTPCVYYAHSTVQQVCFIILDRYILY